MTHSHSENHEEVEKFADDMDRASQLEMAYTADCIREAQRRTQQAQTPDEDGNYAVLDCVECGNEIGLGRLRAAAKNNHCIACATAQEKRNRRA